MEVGDKLKEKYSEEEHKIVQVNAHSILIETKTGNQWVIAERNYKHFKVVKQ